MTIRICTSEKPGKLRTFENTDAREVEALRDIRDEETYRGNYDTAIEAEDAAQELVDQMKQKY